MSEAVSSVPDKILDTLPWVDQHILLIVRWNYEY